MLFINIMMLNRIDVPLIKQIKLIQLSLMSFLMRDKVFEWHMEGGDIELKRYDSLITINKEKESGTHGH